MTAAAEFRGRLRAATEHQPAARARAGGRALAAPVHAYLLAGPAGHRQAAAARAFAAELLAAGAADPADARRRALADPSPHPDLVWLRPPGTQHLVDEVRGRVIAAAAYRPFEADRRVFVIEAADAMAEESQNALLKTLEEPAAYAHLILISAEPAALLETVRSRCQRSASPRSRDRAVEDRLAELGLGESRAERRAAPGSPAATRTARPSCSASAAASCATRPSSASTPPRCGRARASAVERPPGGGRGGRSPSAGEAGRWRRRRRGGEGRRPSGRPQRGARPTRPRGASARRARTEALDLGLALIAAWLRDLPAVAEGAEELSAEHRPGGGAPRDAEGPRRPPRAARRPSWRSTPAGACR